MTIAARIIEGTLEWERGSNKPAHREDNDMDDFIVDDMNDDSFNPSEVATNLQPVLSHLSRFEHMKLIKTYVKNLPISWIIFVDRLKYRSG